MGIAGKILIVDDEPEALENCRRILSRLHYDCLTESDPVRAVRVMERERPGLVLTDFRMPGLDGLGVLNAAKGLDPDVQVVLLTAYAAVQTAVTSMRQGAFDYISKPFTSAELEQVVRRAFGETEAGPNQPGSGTPPRERGVGLEPIVGRSPAIRQSLDLVKKVALTSANILVYGESGTGKELIARAIHGSSPRAQRPFVPVDCAALPDTLLESELFGHEKGAFTGAHSSKPGLFELASGGTIFLDEVSGMSPNLQARLLRVLQERQVRRVGGTCFTDVDVRVIAASNRDLEEASRQGRFREDLFYRLNVIPLTLPPLRLREGDIPLLAEEFLKRYALPHFEQPPSFDPAAMRLLSAYHWPGNVRELRNVVERAAALADGPLIRVEHLPERLLGGAGAASGKAEAASFKDAKQEVVRMFERRYLADLLKRHDGHIGNAANEAGVDRKTIERMIKKHRLRELP